ncbi:MAG: hypothetical protein CBC47_08405 [Alphaproteobacteria bacterium TMED87]|nr:hypothetical protein [Rhodospirillaceae bacterium]OUV07935.1 MAG: hypothetical protein CBC47_08405 [Alphaproteobacteria bacterium TMED87]
MSEKEAQTLQEVIKLAVDAADVATDASFEFKKIKDANSKVINAAEKIYKQGLYVFFASSAVLFLAITIVGLLAFTKLGNVENMVDINKTAVTTFAQNVVDLKNTMEKIDEGLNKNTNIIEAVSESGEVVKTAETTIGRIEDQIMSNLNSVRGEVEAIKKALSDMEGTMGRSIDGSSSTIARRVLSQLGDGVAQEGTLARLSTSQEIFAETLTNRIADLEKQIVAISSKMQEEAKRVKYP